MSGFRIVVGAIIGASLSVIGASSVFAAPQTPVSALSPVVVTSSADYTYNEDAWQSDYNNLENLSQSEREALAYQMWRAGVLTEAEGFKLNVAGTQEARDRAVNSVLSDSSNYMNYRAETVRTNIIQRDSISPEEVVISDYTRQAQENYYAYESGLVPLPPDHPDWGTDTPPTWEEWNEIARPILDNYMETWERGYRSSQAISLNEATARNAERLTSSDPAIRAQYGYDLSRQQAAAGFVYGGIDHLSNNALGNIDYLREFDFSVDYTDVLNSNRDNYNTSTSRIWTSTAADVCDNKKIANARAGLLNNRNVICEVTKVVNLAQDPGYTPLNYGVITPGMPGDVVQRILDEGWEPDNAVDGSAFKAVANACHSSAGVRSLGGTVTVDVPHYYTGFSPEALASLDFQDSNGERISGARGFSDYFKSALSITGASVDGGSAYSRAYNAVISNWSIGRPNGGYYETGEVDCINQVYQIDTMTCAVAYDYSLNQINGDEWLGTPRREIVPSTSISTGVNEALSSGNANEVVRLCLESNARNIDLDEDLDRYGLFELNSKATNKRIIVTHWGANPLTGEQAKTSLGAYEFGSNSYLNITGRETPGPDAKTYLQYTCKGTNVSGDIGSFSPSNYTHTECYDPTSADSYTCYATDVLGYINGEKIPQDGANVMRDGEDISIQFPPVTIIVKEGDSLEGNAKTQIRRDGTPWNANGARKPANDNDIVIQNPENPGSNTGFIDDNSTAWLERSNVSSKNTPTNSDLFLRVELDIAGDISQIAVSEDGIVSGATGRFSFNQNYLNSLVENNVDISNKDLVFILSQDSVRALTELHGNISTENGFIINVDSESVRVLLEEKIRSAK